MAGEDIESGEGVLQGIGIANIPRREMLKKGALVGGAIAWAVPAVEIVGTKVAAAASGSPGAACTAYAGSTITSLCGATIKVGYNTGTGTSTSYESVRVASDCSKFSSGPTPSGDLSFQLKYNSTFKVYEVIVTASSSSDDITFVSVTVGTNTQTPISNKEETCYPLYILPGGNPF